MKEVLDKMFTELPKGFVPSKIVTNPIYKDFLGDSFNGIEIQYHSAYEEGKIHIE